MNATLHTPAEMDEISLKAMQEQLAAAIEDMRGRNRASNPRGYEDRLDNIAFLDREIHNLRCKLRSRR